MNKFFLAGSKKRVRVNTVMRSHVMPTAKGPQSFAPAPAAVTAGMISQLASPDDLAAFADEYNVRYMTVLSFLRIVPRRMHVDDIIKLGDKVARIAEATGVPYQAVPVEKMGLLRVFPEWLLRRTYELIGVRLGWPPIQDECEAVGDEGAKLAELLRANERAVKHLHSLRERVDDTGALDHINRLEEFLGEENDRLRERLATEAAVVPAQ